MRRSGCRTSGRLVFLTLRSSITRRPALALSLLLAILVAASDEWHQTFVPGREGCVRDVIIDSAGVAIALAIWAAKSRRSTNLDSGK